MRPVIWSDRASDDYFDILRYISEADAHAAERVAEAIENAGDGLGRYSTGRPGRISGTYEKSVAGLPYVIAYTIEPRRDGEAVIILRVIHTARDWPGEHWPADG